ncbi:glycoside hydrolase family 15 protein [Lentisphaerota bacterium ZTH]|nr:hypothetical protein JYG24_05270 [Lentisphaerota bacterium]WET07086.1 glycoside hydrolase family 15 protein [Lentisphaerota bacterium ZTH]
MKDLKLGSRRLAVMLLVVFLALPVFAEWPYKSHKIDTIVSLLCRNLIKSNGSVWERSGFIPGAVIASNSEHSTGGGSYFAHWVRDGALVMNTLVNLYKSNHNAMYLGYPVSEYLRNYVYFVRVYSLKSLGDHLTPAKFYIESGEAYKNWSHQDDGPALRSSALTNLAFECLYNPDSDQGLDEEYARETLYPIIKSDLEYTAHQFSEAFNPGNSKGKTTNLWEESYGCTFFTEISQLKALLAGAALSNDEHIDDPGAAQFYVEMANYPLELAQAHWQDNYYYYNQEITGYTAGLQDEWNQRGMMLNISVMLGALYADLRKALDGSGRIYRNLYRDKPGYEASAFRFIVESLNNDPGLFVNSEKMQRTVYEIVRCFSTGGCDPYGINIEDSRFGVGPLVGRYPHDAYSPYNSGQGNPWFLTSLGVAEYYFTLADRLKEMGDIHVTRLNLPFFKMIKEDIIPGTYDAESHSGMELLEALRARGEMIVGAVRRHCEQDTLEMSEQINRNTGFMEGASNLTWSYSSLVRAWLAYDSMRD